MKRLLFIPFLLLASLAWAYHPGLVGVIGRQSSGSLTGTFGNTNETGVATLWVANGGMYLRKITIPSSGSNPTIHVQAFYLLNNDYYEAVPVIYNSSGALVWRGSVYKNTSASDPWIETYSFSTNANLVSGDYFVGIQVENSSSFLMYSAASGADVNLYDSTAVPWNGGVPPSSLPAATSTSSYNAIVWLEF